MIVFLFISLLYTLLAYTNSFAGIITISFGISFGLAIVRPIISSITSNGLKKDIVGSITGAEQFVGRVGDVVGAVLFGLISTILGLETAFVVIGIILFVSSFWILFKKFVIKKIKLKNNLDNVDLPVSNL